MARVPAQAPGLRLIPLLLVSLALALAIEGQDRSARAASAGSDCSYLPMIGGHKPPTPTPRPTPSPAPDVCRPIPGQQYGTLSIVGDPTDRPAEQHADLNLALRDYAPAASSATQQAANNCSAGSDDPRAPQLRGLFADDRRPTFCGVYRVWTWDWGANHRGTSLEPGLSACGQGAVSLAMVCVTPGEILYVPASEYSISNTGGYEVLVLYASEERITLKYTREDNVIRGYTLHLENLCVNPDLLALYRQMNAAGRRKLPALKAGQAFARTCTNTMGLVIRDNGNWMDPRCCNDWWRTP